MRFPGRLLEGVSRILGGLGELFKKLQEGVWGIVGFRRLTK